VVCAEGNGCVTDIEKMFAGITGVSKVENNISKIILPI
jgi:hypothetical protein